jgi:hypothetical protein
MLKRLATVIAPDGHERAVACDLLQTAYSGSWGIRGIRKATFARAEHGIARRCVTCSISMIGGMGRQLV